MRALLLAGIVLALGATAAEARYVDFRTPSGNIGCAYSDNPRPSLRCDILQSSDMPQKPRSCDLDYGYAYAMHRRGKVITLCAGDTVVNQNAPVLHYGKSKRVGGFTCRSRMRGLRCKNKSGHGIFLSRARIEKF
jgi:uncharacterized protein DUF6636